MSAAPLPVDEGLLARFRAAGEKIAWRSAARRSPRAATAAASARVAHLNDEEARVERSGPERGPTVVVDSGPVGALVLLLEIDRRGPPVRLVAHDAGRKKGFGQGAIEASWGKGGRSNAPPLPITDLVGLARYALA